MKTKRLKLECASHRISERAGRGLEIAVGELDRVWIEPARTNEVLEKIPGFHEGRDNIRGRRLDSSLEEVRL